MRQNKQAETLHLLESLTIFPAGDAEVALRPSVAVAARTRRDLVALDSLEHTADHANCPACKAFNIALQAEKTGIARLPFPEVHAYWLLRRAQSMSLKQGTHERDDAYLTALGKFFGSMRPCDITPGHLRAYQLARLKNKLVVKGIETKPWNRTAKNSTINHELSLLGRILRHCKLWANIREYYFPLEVPSWSPREILSEEDEKKFFADGAGEPLAALAYWCAIITNNTSVSGCELRGIRLKRLFLRGSGEISQVEVSSESVKNGTRPRMIPLNSSAKWAVQQCYKRALQLGCCEPDHFLFPLRCNRDKNAPLDTNGKRLKWDPSRPASKTFLRRGWARLRENTSQPKLSPHDLRHHFETRLLERGVQPETVTAIMGHRPNSKMIDYYAHHRTRVKHAAVKRVDLHIAKESPRKKPPASVRFSK